ncbi:MAG: sigma-70 family RNA polymerase sigma factor [Clostridia bacterium]|nr:sigma-70 family RNA polymerase sigma factor [Clostridia bacterium]
MSLKSRADELLKQCYSDYRIKLFNYCLARLDGVREAADDCVQEAFIVFYNQLLEGVEFSNPRAFLYRTADNFVKRRRSKSASEAAHEVPLDTARDYAASEPSFSEAVNNIDYDELAKRLIEELDEDDRTLYKKRYIDKLGVEDISKELNISRPAASMRLIRLRNKVRDMVLDLNLEEGG